MLPRGIRVLNFDDSTARQAEFLQATQAEIISFLDLGRSARLWADRSQAAAIRRRLDPAQKHAITFIGSGDYHYVSALLLEQFTQPFSLIVFDRHPDWDVLPPRYGCGAWVSRALENRNVAHVLLVGNGPEDLSFPSALTGNRRSVRSGKVDLLPYQIPPPLPWPWLDLKCHALKDDPMGVFASALHRVPTNRVYVSIDKDCLSSAHALTNWEEGHLDLECILGFLSLLKKNHEIIGVDVTGDYSVPVFLSRWKSWCSRIDHPSDFTAKTQPHEQIDFINGRTNQKLVDLLRAAI